MPDSPRELLLQFPDLPMLRKVFMPYLEWLQDNAQNEGEDHKLVKVLRAGDRGTLQGLEDLLRQSKNLLRLSPDDFTRVFGFKTDLLIDDPEKIHDVIAEPLLVVKLAERGFTEINKLPKSIKVDGKEIAVADFTAELRGRRFAVELKTIRTEAWIEPSKLSGNAGEPDWWGKMFLSNAVTKIEDKDRKALKQLDNTYRHYNCQAALLVLYSRRLGVAALSEEHEYREWLEKLKDDYPIVDCFACMDYYGLFVVEPDVT